ncbi:hypothetical protein CFC21_044779 [Triticum aestivum]|uniref:Uncharacterized protein n=2 Tax=Triticum aestivum TaxID=4565 RepID=A0A9R1FT45_WHEAT|nr:uncharacterized protein LOC123066904 [Triticum aestivum]KAF7033692.1 hypothetical protein CFC21_044779 [Triticum aestivum]CDM86943.1 unnamed protein product [Triticum aestivum]
MPQKRLRRRRRRSPRRRRGEEGASLSAPLVESDSSSVTSGAPAPEPLDEPPAREYESRYHEMLASRLAVLPLPAYADEEGPDLPSDETFEALVRPYFYDDELRAALVQYQAHKLLSGPDDVHGRDGDSEAEVDSSSSLMDDITEEEFVKYSEELKARSSAEIDTDTRLNQEQFNRLHVKYVRYRIKACLLLKGKHIDELDDATLERKCPIELALGDKDLSPYLEDGAFGWYFDSDLCLLSSLSDYQRLVLPNCTWSEYESLSQYIAFYNTPEVDRDYVLYWEKMVKEIKWLEYHVLKEDTPEWDQIRRKGLYQAIRIAAEFPNIDFSLAYYGFMEYIWRTRFYVVFVKGLDRAYFEIWERVTGQQMCFRDALQEVCNENSVPSRQHTLKDELKRPGGFLQLEQQLRRCTEGISKEVPDWIAREMISQEVRFKRALPKTYAQYARKKLKVAEAIGLIPKAKA